MSTLSPITIVCVFSVLIALGVSNIIIGFNFENDECQHSTRGGLILSDWNKIVGFEKLGVMVILSMLVFFGHFGNNVGVGSCMVLIVLEQLFCGMLYVWGIVLIATNENNSCVNNEMGVFTIVNLALATVGFWSYPVYLVKEYIQ